MRASQDDARRFRAEGGLDPSLEVAIPPDQRPVNELASLRGAPLYSWVSLTCCRVNRGAHYLKALDFTDADGPVELPPDWCMLSDRADEGAAVVATSHRSCDYHRAVLTD